MPALITIPHGSTDVPPEIFARMLESGEPEAALRRRLLLEGDPLTDRIYDIPGATVVHAPWSRYAADLNRAPIETGPDGVIRETDFALRSWYPAGHVIDDAERARRIHLYHAPFHSRVEEVLAGGNIRFLLDGHSMNAGGPALGPDPGRARPALCLVNLGDSDGEPRPGLPVSLEPERARALRTLGDSLIAQHFPGWPADSRARLNEPFNDGYILERYTHPNFRHRVPGLLCEFNRALYWDEARAEPLPGAVGTLRGITIALIKAALGEES